MQIKFYGQAIFFYFNSIIFYLREMSYITIPTSFNIDLSLEIAPFHYRFFAFIIDKFIMAAYLYLILKIWFKLNLEEVNGEMLIAMFFFLPVFLYSLFFETYNNGSTPGKAIMGLKVMSMDGRQASFSQYLIRWLMEYVDFSPLTFFLGGFVCAATTKYTQRLGDLAAGTIVVKKKINFEIDDTIFVAFENSNYKPTFPQVMRITDHDINAIDTILKSKYVNQQNLHHTANVVKNHLKIDTEMDDYIFLQTLLMDYNFLSIQEN